LNCTVGSCNFFARGIPIAVTVSPQEYEEPLSGFEQVKRRVVGSLSPPNLRADHDLVDRNPRVTFEHA
jgi:hypothetical protein